MYGYSLVKELEGKGIPIEGNTLYPLLRRLESQGLLKSEWETDAAKPRKYYIITEDGKLVYKKIKALTNLSVVEFIRSIRLNYAMEKLRSGEYNVTEVSEMCGFNTSAYFSKVFKEYFGKTPTEVMQNSAL